MDDTSPQEPIVEITIPDVEPITSPSPEPGSSITPATVELIPETKAGVDKSDDISYALEDIAYGRVTSERVLEEYVSDNIKTIWKDVFAEDATECIRQYAEAVDVPRDAKNPLLYRGSRVDLFVKCASGNNYLVEIKNPAEGRNETMNAVGKLLFYSTIFPKGNKLVLLSTIYERAYKDMIAKYHLPIQFMLFGKDGIYLLT